MKVIRVTKNLIKNSYSSFDANTLRVGDIVSHDIYIKRSSQYIIIIEAQTPLNERLYNILQNQDNLYIVHKEEDNVYILDSQVNHPVDINCKTLLIRIKHNKNNFIKDLELLYNINGNVFNNFLENSENKIDLFCIASIVESIIFLIKQHTFFVKKIMPHLHDNYKLPIHSLHVAIYALHIGILLHFSDEKLLKLGKAALVHDIGKKNMDAIVDKHSALNLEELELTKQHSSYSVDILKAHGIEDALIIDAVKHHHERYDGSGYPDNLLRSQISEFASILAVCDVFDALTTARPYRKGNSTFESLKLMMKEPSMTHQFNHEYIKLLLI
ncbi:HD domain-containing protein [bacterium]|nr:HD domain-containing protein [bacterium]MBU1994178.1 HD domain-containing protein [bacterium]